MSDTFKAAIWMIGAIASFTSMAIAGRAVSFELDTFEIMMFRSFVGIVLVLSIAGYAGTLNQVRFRNLGLHGIRNLCHFTGQNLWFYALTLIPLAQLFALEFTSPLWVLLLSPIFLGERLTRPKALAALVGFTGVLIVVRPDFTALNVGVLFAASSAIFFACTAIATRKLTRTESITCILFHLTVMQAVFGIIATGWDGDIALPSSTSVPWIILIGCAGLLAHFCLTKALSLAPAGIVMPMDFVRLPVIAIIGAAFYNEAIDIWVFVGALLIFGANYANIRLESRRVTNL